MQCTIGPVTCPRVSRDWGRPGFVSSRGIDLGEIMTRLIRGIATPLAALVLAFSSVASVNAAAATPPTPVSPAPAPTAPTPPPPSAPPTPFYNLPFLLPDGGPGTIIKTEPVTVPGLHGTMIRVMYKSKSILGVDIAVTGLIAVPSTPPPSGGYPVVSWAHGTTGIADSCAPSIDPSSDAGLANAILDRGWVLTATDFEGLGTPGRHPYIVGDSEARGVIDIVRAARNLPDVHATNNYVVWGHSQGGHAAMFALHIADSWAPELNLKGVVAGAPPSQLNLVYNFLVSSPYKYYLLMVAAAINAAYGDVQAPLGAVLNANGIDKVNLVDNGCTGYLESQTTGVNVQDLMVQQADGTYNPASNPIWGPLIDAQDPRTFTSPSPTPLLIIHGGADMQIPTVSSQMLAGQLCPLGQDLERWVYPGQSHAGVIAPSMGDMLTWITHRFDNGVNPDPLIPTGQADVQPTVCINGQMVTADAALFTPPTTTPPTTVPTVPGPPATAPVPAPVPTSAPGPAQAIALTPTYTG